LNGVRTDLPRALLLEREEALRHVLTEVLRDLGFDVLACGGRRQALTSLLRHPDVELVVVDLVDATADGEAVVTFLADLPETASIPLLVMTDGEHATAAPRAVQLAKPFGLEEFVSAVRSSTRRERTPAAPREVDEQDGAR
jgi:CheY-like chemotaxis protein